LWLPFILGVKVLTRWKVSYSFSSPVIVQSPVSAYSHLGISLHYEHDTQLLRVEHDFYADEKTEAIKVIIKSQDQLKLFWELLHYQRGIPLPINDISATKLDPEGLPRIHTGMTSIMSRASICKAIVMRDEKVFIRNDNRLLVWLWLANKARHFIDTPDGNVDAIRNYYMIWEDLYGEPNKNTKPVEAWELKLIRDLVSHGYKLGNKELRKLTKAQCGKPVNQFDPTDSVQQSLVHRYRTIGRELVEAELDRMMS
jgi:hypothetical protein